jgi:hypothetical protein
MSVIHSGWKGISALGLVSLALAGCGAPPAPAASPNAPAASSAASSVPATSTEQKRLNEVGADLDRTADAIKRNDATGAKAAFKAYDDGWTGIEVYVKARSKDLYGQIEDVQGQIDKGLLETGSPSLQPLAPKITDIQQKFDQAMKLAQAKPEYSPVLDNLAMVRWVRGDVRNTIAAVKANDAAGAKTAYTKFGSDWSAVQDAVKASSPDTYQGVEDARSETVPLMAQPTPPADKLSPLLDQLLARVTNAVTVVNNQLPADTQY